MTNLFASYKRWRVIQVDIKKEKSNIIVRSIEIKEGKETVVEETLDKINTDASLISEEEINKMFDVIFPDE